jgi:hypothetical protein
MLRPTAENYEYMKKVEARWQILTERVTTAGKQLEQWLMDAKPPNAHDQLLRVSYVWRKVEEGDLMAAYEELFKIADNYGVSGPRQVPATFWYYLLQAANLLLRD